MRTNTKVRLRTVGISAGVLMLTAGGAYAAGEIDSRDIADESVRSVDLRDGRAVGSADLRPELENRIANLEDRVTALENEGTDGGIQAAVWRDAQPDDSSEVTIDATSITVDLAAEDAPPAGAGASAETNDLGVDVQAGDVIAFDLDLGEGTVCQASNLRMFVAVNGEFINSGDGNPDACGGEDGRVEFSVPSNGSIRQAGFVNDGNTPGSATFSNLTIDGQAVPFE